MRRFHSLLVLGALAPLSSAGPQWRSSSYDVYGYSSIPKSTLRPDVARALKLIDTDPRSAYAVFMRQYDDNPVDATVYFGLMLSAKKCDRSFDAIERVAKAFSAARQKVVKSGNGRSMKVDKHFSIAFSLGLAMVYSSDIPGGDSGYMERLRPLSKAWYGTLATTELEPENISRLEALLVGSSGLMQGKETMVRRVLQQVSERHPDDVALHMLLCRAYSQGTYSLSQGNKPIPVPDDERSKPELALREALAAVRLDPDLLDANYLAGYYLTHSNPRQAKRYWKRFIALLPPSTPDKRREFVLKWLKAN